MSPTSYEPHGFPYQAPGLVPGSLPSSGDFLAAVRETCLAATTGSAPDITLADDAAIDAFIQQINDEVFIKLSDNEPLRVPLRFESLIQELNYVAMLAYLQIGSGYRVLLKESTGRGAAETIMFGMLSAFIGGQKVDAEALKNLSKREIAGLFGIEYETEVAHPSMPGVYILEKTALAGLVDLLHFLLKDLGESLEKLGHKTLASFILEVTKAPAGTRPKAARLVEALATNFKGFRDATSWNGKPIYLFKKAQLVAGDCYKAFKSKAPQNFDFDDVDQLTVFADNVLPCVLIQAGLIKVSQDIQKRVDDLEDLGLPPNALSQIDSRLRAAAVTVCDRIVARVKQVGSEVTKKTNAVELDHYLWNLGKEPEHRKLTRMVNRQTYFY